MSKMSELSIQLQEAEAQREPQVSLADYEKGIKAHKDGVKEFIKQKDKPKVKSVDGRQLIVRGIIDEVTSIKANFGYSWRIKMSGAVYYYNSKFENSAAKMGLVAGEKLACTVKESGKYLILDTIFFTF